MAVNTASEPMHLLVADAHHAVLDGSPSAVPIIDSMIARLTRAKAAHEAGNIVVASREFDPNYVVRTTRVCRYCGESAEAVADGTAPRTCSKVPGSEGLVGSHSYHDVRAAV